jgi:hypothetical protein
MIFIRAGYAAGRQVDVLLAPAEAGAVEDLFHLG